MTADHSSGPQITHHPAIATAVVPGRDIPYDGLPAFFDQAFGTLLPALSGASVQITGPAFAHYRPPMGATFTLDAGFPIAGTIRGIEGVQADELPGCRVARLVLSGGYDLLPGAWQQLGDWVGEQGLTPDTELGFWEVYLTEPSPQMDPADLRTELNLPLRD